MSDSHRAEPAKRGSDGGKGGRLWTISTAVAVYLIGVIAGPTLLYRLLATERNWGEFWRVAAGPTGTMLAAAGAVMAAYLTVLNGESNRRQDRDSTDRDRRSATERDLRSRFTSAAEQLGDKRFNVRQAGAYAMAAIADDWLALAADEPMGAREAQVCVDVLCAILRAAPADQPAADKTEEPSDQPVRSMIIHIIASHLRRDTEPSWRQLRFDLKGAHLHDVNLSECHFQGSLILANAHLSGEQATFTDSHFANVTFDHATFQTGTTAEFTHTTWDTTAVFQYTEFGGNLNFDRANFNAGASFTGASLGTRVGAASEASFKEAEFVGTADFTYARVYCSMAEFYGATFNGPALFKRLQANQPEKSASISFHSATFHGPADFEACHVGSHTDFRESKFLGDLKTPTALDDTYFDSEEAVRFNDAEFVVAEFDKAQFSRQVSFYGAKWIFEARFPSAKFTAPVRFEKTTFHNGATFVGVEFVCGADFYRVDFGDQPVDFTNPAVWNDVRVDWDGSSPFHSSVPPQPSNVLPEDWTSNRASERRPATRT